MDKVVSIIIPVYNVSNYIAECIESVLRQTYPHWEMLLVDDGSTDCSGDICDNYANTDARIRVIHQENAGAANAKNTGLDSATGAYIAFIDSDDYVDSQWLFKTVSALESNQADMVEYAFQKVYTSHIEPGNTEAFSEGEFSAEKYLAQYLSDWTCSLFWNKVFKAELTEGIRFRKERRCIDDEFYTYKVASRANKILRMNECFYYYRQRRSSAVSSEKNRLQISDDAVEVLIERYKWVSKHFPPLRKTYLEHDVSILWYFVNHFQFRATSIKNLRKTASFYFWQSVLHYPRLYLIHLSLKVCLLRNHHLTCAKKTAPSQIDTSDLFQ